MRRWWWNNDSCLVPKLNRIVIGQIINMQITFPIPYIVYYFAMIIISPYTFYCPLLSIHRLTIHTIPRLDFVYSAIHWYKMSRKSCCITWNSSWQFKTSPFYYLIKSLMQKTYHSSLRNDIVKEERYHLNEDFRTNPLVL